MAKAAKKDSGRAGRFRPKRGGATGRFVSSTLAATGTGGSRAEASSDRQSVLESALSYAAAHGLVREGSKTERISARVDPALLQAAKEKTGIASTTDLVEAALARLAAADDFGAWLVSQRGTVAEDLDLEL